MPAISITLYEPYASLFVTGAKPWETRPSAPNGYMRTVGRPGYPGLPINPGDRVGVHASKKQPVAGTYGLWKVSQTDGQWEAVNATNGETVALHPGAMVGEVEFDRAIPITAPGNRFTTPHIVSNRQDLLLVDESGVTNISDQFELGIWTPGRSAWEPRYRARWDERCLFCAPPQTGCTVCDDTRQGRLVFGPGNQGVWATERFTSKITEIQGR